MASRNHDVVIVGAGHNGLVTAFYLARAGLKPLILERRSVVGGSAVTEEFHPGFRCPSVAHVCEPLAPEIERDMQLGKHGLQMIQPEPRVVALAPDGRALPLFTDPEKSAMEIARFSGRDAGQYREFQRVLLRMGKILNRVLRMEPPSLVETDVGDLWNLGKTAQQVRGLGEKDMFRLLRWPPMAVADLVNEWFETELLRAMVAAQGIIGVFGGPWSAGTGAVFLLRTAGDGHPAGSSVYPRGGVGALTQALADAARRAGAVVRTDADVAHVSVKDGAVSGVVLGNGEEIPATAVISNADPKRTFLSMIDPTHLAPSFLLRIRNFLARGVAAKVNLALDAPPSFSGLDQAPTGRLHIGPEMDYLERAFDAAKYGRFSGEPWLDVLIPSVADPSLAPEGKHVLSAWVQFAPFELRNTDWNAQREALGDAVIRKLSEYAPDLPEKIIARQVITPLDLQQTYGLTGGHVLHGELALDQLFTMRPLLEWARYDSPLRGLYLCGSGTHPGTGLNGLSGANAARAILKSLPR